MTILAISGSLRKASFNSALLKAFEKRAGSDVSFVHADIGTLPLFNQDHEKDAYPREAQALKDAIRAADGVIIATPEYNRSIPGPLKNAVDWVSRPYGDNAFAGKPVLVVGASGGAIGTALAQYALKQSLLYLDARVMGQPEFMLGGFPAKFDADGNLADEDTGAHIDKALAAFVAHIGKTR